MPSWLVTFLADWGPAAGVIGFAAGALGAVFSLFINGTLVTGAQLRLVRELYEIRLAELQKDLADMIAERDFYREVAHRGTGIAQQIVPNPERNQQ